MRELTRQSWSQRRILIGASAALIGFDVLNITVEKIPSLGFQMEFPPETIPFILKATIFYFIVSYTASWIYDLADNRERLSYFRANEWVHEKISFFRQNLE